MKQIQQENDNEEHMENVTLDDTTNMQYNSEPSKWNYGFPIDSTLFMDLIHTKCDDSNTYHNQTTACSHDNEVCINVCATWMDIFRLHPLNKYTCTCLPSVCCCHQPTSSRLRKFPVTAYINIEMILGEALRYDSVECFKYAYELDDQKQHPQLTMDASTYSKAINMCALNCLRYIHKLCNLHDNGFLCTEAASCGSLECLRYLHDNGCIMNDNIILYAMINDNAKMLKYILTFRTENDHNVFIDSHRAALFDAFKCMNYLRKHGYQWDGMTCLCAAYIGSTPMLAYLHENGCPWTCTEDYSLFGIYDVYLDNVLYGSFPCITNNDKSECINYAYNNGFQRHTTGYISTLWDQHVIIYTMTPEQIF